VGVAPAFAAYGAASFLERTGVSERLELLKLMSGLAT
jgi:hypothetical protein